MHTAEFQFSEIKLILSAIYYLGRWDGGRWTVGRWDGGTVGRWDGGTVGRWDGGTVGRWDGGTVGRWDGGTVGRWDGGRWRWFWNTPFFFYTCFVCWAISCSAHYNIDQTSQIR